MRERRRLAFFAFILLAATCCHDSSSAVRTELTYRRVDVKAAVVRTPGPWNPGQVDGPFSFSDLLPRTSKSGVDVVFRLMDGDQPRLSSACYAVSADGAFKVRRVSPAVSILM